MGGMGDATLAEDALFSIPDEASNVVGEVLGTTTEQIAPLPEDATPAPVVLEEEPAASSTPTVDEQIIGPVATSTAMDVPLDTTASSTIVLADVIEESMLTPATTTIDKQLASIPAQEKAFFKGREIAKLNTVSRTKRQEHDIQVLWMMPTMDGVEGFARAWDKGGNRIRGKIPKRKAIC